MLIKFTVENYLSFNGKVELSLVAGKYRSLPHHVIKRKKRNDVNLLKSAVIYGANASGKSNLVKAIDFGRNMIVKGTKAGQQIPTRIFKLDAKNYQQPTKFQYDIKVKGKIYSYGFSLDSRKIHDEWLSLPAKAQETYLFTRKTDSDDRVEVNFGKNLYSTVKERNFLQFVAQGTRSNQLFLTEAIQRNVKQLKDVYEWFSDRLKIIFPESQVEHLAEILMTDKHNIKNTFLKLLKGFDTGISNIATEQIPLSKVNLPTEVKEKIEKDLKEDQIAIVREMPTRKTYNISKGKEGEFLAIQLITQHKMKDSKKEVSFELNDESDGTKRIMDFIPALTNLRIEDDVYIIDEIDRSLHPHLTTAILDIFLNKDKQHNNQLIVTTHESNLLNLELLRRDEIWFVDKNKDGETTIFSLEEFQPRYDKDIRKAYLLGRFGAIPSLVKSRQREQYDR